MVDYYCQCLPYYNNIITGRVNYPINEIKEHNTIVESSIKDSTDVSSSLSSDNGNPDSSLDKAPAVSFEERKNQIEVNIFQSVFDKKASSYKYFWLMAIVSLAKDKGALSISYQDIVIRMAAIAWPIVLDYEIDLGASDMMRKYLEDVVKNTTLIRQATSNVVEKYLSQHYSSQGIDKVLSPLLKNVPYRFLSPWVKYTTDEEVIATSQSKYFNGLYALYPNHIVLDEDWWDYIESHYSDICDFSMKSFIAYVKKFNTDIKLLKLMTTGWQLIKKK